MPEMSHGLVYGGLLFSRRVLRFGLRLGLVVIAGTLLAIATYRLTQLWLVPEVTVAIANSESEYGRLFNHLRRLTGSTNLNLHVVTLADSTAVADALERRRADFAVVRTDQSLPSNAMTTAILREDILVIAGFDVVKDARWVGTGSEKSHEKGNGQDAAGLALDYKRIGAIGMGATDRALLDKVLAFHGAAGTSVADFTDLSDMRSAITGNQIDAIALIGQARQLREYLAPLVDLAPTILPISAAAFATEYPLIGKSTLSANVLGRRLPKEDQQTPSVSWRLVGRRDLERAIVSDVLQALFAHRLALARESDLAWPIKGVDEEGATFAKLPNHRGALDYYSREQQTFMDRYGDWLWLGLFAAGGVSSVAAWLVQVLSRRRRQLVEGLLDRLLKILGKAREAKTIEELDKLTLEVDSLITYAIRRARWRASDPISTAALTLAIDSSRAAIADRRAFVAQDQGRAARSARRTTAV